MKSGIKKAIIVNNNFYNQESLDFIKQYVGNTLETLEKIYWKLGGLENKILTEEEMIAIYNFVDLLKQCEILDVRK